LPPNERDEVHDTLCAVTTPSNRRPKLSVCCVSAAPLERTAAMLGLFRDIAEEIVCAVDEQVDEEDLAALDGVVDVVQRFAHDSEAGCIERRLLWVTGLCSGRWVLRLDNDEVPGQELLTKLPALVEADDVLQYVLPCRWLFPDRGHYLGERPWSEDWHVRLVRNEPIALRFSGVLHSTFDGVEPLRFVELPFYHLDCIVNSRESREAKAARYEAILPGRETMPGWSVNNHYLPEKFQKEPSLQVPPEDISLIAKVLDGVASARSGRWDAATSQIAITPLEEIDRTWPLRRVSSDAYRATWLSVPHIEDLEARAPRRIYVEVRNDGTETWPYGAQLPAFRLGYRWMSSDGTAVIADGIPTAFTADVRPGETILQPMVVQGPEEPGEYRIQFALVHQDVCWFGEGPSFPLNVRVP